MESKKNYKNPTYLCYSAMKWRCYCKTNTSYKHYWWRWISVCNRWLWKNWYENFLSDMWERPNWHSLDRIEVDWNYEEWNCKRSTVIEQNRNKSNTNSIMKEVYMKGSYTKRNYSSMKHWIDRHWTIAWWDNRRVLNERILNWKSLYHRCKLLWCCHKRAYKLCKKMDIKNVLIHLCWDNELLKSIGNTLPSAIQGEKATT